MSQAFRPSGLSFRQRGILVVATASALGDSYCSQIFAITAFVALRQAVTYGRPVAT